MDIQPEREIGGSNSSGSGRVAFKGKTVQVILVDEARAAFGALETLVQEERARGITSSDHQILLRSIQQKIALLKTNPHCGTHITKRQIPKEYLREYSIRNLWKINLSGGWRMLYANRSTEIEIVAFVLDILNHRDYEKKFGYRKS